MSNSNRLNAVRNTLRRNDYEKNVEKVDLIVHPGFYEHTNSFDHLDGLGPEEYEEYRTNIYERLKDFDTKNYVLSRKEDLQEVNAFLDEHQQYVDKYVQTSVLSGIYLEKEASKIAELFGTIQDGGKIMVSGEMNGFCTQQAIESFEDIEKTLKKDIKIEKGSLFPQKELERTEGVIHWKGENKRYKNALEYAGIR